MKILKQCLIVFAISLLFALPARADEPSVEKAIKKALAIAADECHGYSQINRWGNPDYDCSSFIYTVFTKAGFPITKSGDRYTVTIPADFKAAGFQWISWSKLGGVSNLKRGDILLNTVAGSRHCELYLGDLKLVGAHHDYGSSKGGDQSGKEISTGYYYSHPWSGVLRYDSSKASAALITVSSTYESSGTPLVRSIRIKGAKKTLKAGKTLKLTAKVSADAGADKAVKWKSSNKKYAVVTQKGKVKAKKAGRGKTVKISVSAKDGSGVKKTIKIKIK